MTIPLLSYSSPGTQMYLIDRDRSIKSIVTVSLLHPCLVSPVIIQIPDDRGCFGRRFIIEGKGVSFLHTVGAVMRENVILVDRVFTQPRDKPFPDTGLPFWAQKVT
jgi:hypothetical protein